MGLVRRCTLRVCPSMCSDAGLVPRLPDEEPSSFVFVGITAGVSRAGSLVSAFDLTHGAPGCSLCVFVTPFGFGRAWADRPLRANDPATVCSAVASSLFFGRGAWPWFVRRGGVCFWLLGPLGAFLWSMAYRPWLSCVGPRFIQPWLLCVMHDSWRIGRGPFRLVGRGLSCVGRAFRPWLAAVGWRGSLVHGFSFGPWLAAAVASVSCAAVRGFLLPSAGGVLGPA